MTKSLAPYVYGVVVTYEPDPARLKQVLEAAAPQLTQLLIVDNSESLVATEIVSAAAQALSATSASAQAPLLHQAPSNLGLSWAYNLAIARAKSAGADYLLLLDQDSVVAPDMVSALLAGFAQGKNAAHTYRMQDAPAMVGPWYTDELTGRRSVFLRSGRFGMTHRPLQTSSSPVVPTEMLISSGSLVSMSVFDTVGELDAALFIDHIDTDWCLRLKHHGFWMAVVRGANMRHRLGDRVQRLWWGRFRVLPVHGDIRLYYTFRNSLWLYRRPHAHWRWVLFDIKRLCAVTLIHMLASGPRLPRIRMIVRGVYDGLRGKAERDEFAE